MKTGWVVGEFVDVIKTWVNLFHSFGRCVKIFWSGWHCQCHPLLRWQWHIHPLIFIVLPTLYNQTLSSPTTVDEFTHFKTVCFLHPHYFKTNHSRNSPIQLLSDRSIGGTTTSTQLSHMQIRHHCDMWEWVLSFIIIHVLIHTFKSHLLHTVWGGLCYDQRCLCSPTRYFHPRFPFTTEINFCLFVGEQKWETSTDKKSRLGDIYHHWWFSPTNFHPPLWPTRVPIHAQTSTQIHPFHFTHLFSPTHFHPPISPTFFHLPFFTHLFPPSLFAPSLIPFTRCATEINFHPRFALFSPTCRFHLLVDFTHLQMSCTCRFHLLADFIYLPISSVCTWWAGVHPCFYYFIRNSLVVLMEPLFAEMLWLALSVFACTSFRPTVSLHSLSHRNQNSPTIPCALWFHPLQISPTLLLSGPCSSYWTICSFDLRICFAIDVPCHLARQQRHRGDKHCKWRQWINSAFMSLEPSNLGGWGVMVVWTLNYLFSSHGASKTSCHHSLIPPLWW